MNTADPELVRCLEVLVSPPGMSCVHLRDGDLPAGPLAGAVVLGDQDPARWQQLCRALLPGAHVALVPGDAVGDQAACAAEDAGLEVRDAIFVARGADDLVFAPKTSRREKEEGLHELPARPGHVAVKRKPGSAGLRYARAGAGRTAKEVRNHHPTSKPVAVMAQLLRRLGVGAGPVWDPFAGTGSTAVACIRAGIRSVCIEQDASYALIARARIRHEIERRPSGATPPAQEAAGRTPACGSTGFVVYLLRKKPAESTEVTLSSLGTGSISRSALQPASRTSWPPNVVLAHLDACAGGCEPGCPVRAMAEQVSRDAPRRFRVLGEAQPEQRSPWMR